MKITRAAKGAALATTATIGMLVLANTAQAITLWPLTRGRGWTLMNPGGVTSLAPVTYRITFDSTAARTRLMPYMKALAYETQLLTPGVRFEVFPPITPMNKTGCQRFRTIVVSLEYRPVGIKGVGQGGNCYVASDHTLHSGTMRLDTEWWYSKWFSSSPATNEQRIKNAVLHEFGHAIGLGHPNLDLDGDRTVEPYECVKNRNGFRPVMCSPNGGNVNTSAGKWTALEQAALRALTTNYRYR